jgi:hypothetical protein
MAVTLPSLPFPGFPLRPHHNGQWYKSVWNSRSQRTEHFYFGPWKEDPRGERALNDPHSGRLVRRTGIKAGTDNGWQCLAILSANRECGLKSRRSRPTS